MSSSEDSDAGPKRKRKVRRLEDSPASTSSVSPIIGNSSRTRRRNLTRINRSSSESDGSPVLTRKKKLRVSDDSSSDSDIGQTRSGKRRRLESDSEDDDSSQWESDCSDDETEKQKINGIQSAIQNDSESELSDGQSEKCPICLVTFKQQEIGTPESCDHTFCLECIQEWSKNMNTCPVDRQEYSLVLVRSHLNGKVIRQIPIERPVPQNDMDIIEDPTFCEICGSSEEEDRMLLCDGCDLGFHLFCLTPPLSDVPSGSWYCNDCSPDSDNSELDVYELQFMFTDDEDVVEHYNRQQRRTRSNRLIPRTRQTERILRQVQNNRQRNSQNNQASLTIEITRNTDRVSSSTSRPRPTRRTGTRRRRNRNVRYKTVYEIDPTTGETVAVKKRMKRKRKKKTSSSTAKPKTVKKRLAQQLGICAPRTVPQNLPDVKIPNIASTASSNISGIRHNAGIPTLHLFGQNNDLDYFTDEEAEDYSLGSQVLIRRVPTRSDISAMRRTIRRKTVAIPEVVSSTSDLLDSILNSQEQLYARNASYSIDSSGKFKIESKSKNTNYIDVTKEQAKAKETPYYNPNRSYNNRYSQNQNYRPYQNRYQRSSNYYHSNNQFYSNESSSSLNYSNYSNDRDDDFPQDYSNRTLNATTESNSEENIEEQNEQNPNDESELDIYSDIETVTTTKGDEPEYRPLSPPPMPNISINFDDDNDSEPDMVIDDEKMQEHDNQADYNREETAVSSTVGIDKDFQPEPFEGGSDEIQSGSVQSSSFDAIKNYQYYNEDSSDGCPNANIYSSAASKPPVIEEDAESDDGCPNFSIYSKESKTMALHTVTLPSEDYQIGEVTSSPHTKTQEEELEQEEINNDIDKPQEDEEEQVLDNPDDGERLYDPAKIYSPERDTATPLDHSYDPENCVRPDETLNTEDVSNADVEKIDQTYDPENVFEENSNSSDKNVDIEREIFKFASEKNDSSIENRYDPAVPFNDDLDETHSQNADVTNEDKDKDEESAKDTSIDESATDTSKEDTTKTFIKPKRKSSNMDRLYSDSEDDENVVKKDANAVGGSDITQMTEDISEEERSYTPCLDEKGQKQGLEGLDTELISDEDRNDFDESHELKAPSDGDALEINAKESELDFARPEDYEEGEIVDKSKDKEVMEETIEEQVEAEKPAEEAPPEVKKTKKKEKDKTDHDKDKGGDKENVPRHRDASFKRLSKNNKDRNYRDKEKRDGSPRRRFSRDRDNRKDKKKERRRELERYNVRAIIAEKPRPLVAKDQFGRDIRTTPSKSRSRSYTPPPRSSPSRPVRSPSKSRRSLSKSRRRSFSKDKSRKRKTRTYRSLTRSRSPIRKTQKGKKRKRSTSRFRKRKVDDKNKSKRRLAARNRHRTRSPTPVRRARDRIHWTPVSQPNMSPSWTPPRLIDNTQLLRNEHLTVTVNNSKKKKDKRRRDRRARDTLESRQRRKRHERERTPPPSKEVFASGDNILVSVSFNNENERRDVTTRDKRRNEEAKKRKKRKTRRDLTGVKPVAIIDLARSPFREMTPSPKQIIVLTDSDNDDGEMLRNVQNNILVSSQQVASPERGIGPKTPPEPQVKFSLAPKPPQIRAITNPLIDPEDIEAGMTTELSSRISPGLHKGPNTPPEPPNSPPSSPDAYDPFEPTKSRSATPDLVPGQSAKEHEPIDSRAAIDILEKSTNPMPDHITSLTPPLADIQPADSQSSVQLITPDSNLDKSPRIPQTQTVQLSKPVAQTIPFSTVPAPLNTSTPLTTTLPPTRINILNTTVITPPVASPIPQRIVLPNQIKSSSVKISPQKTAIKSTPIKPMPNKTTTKITTKKRNQNGSLDDILDFDSPYSPGSSDYEDLFEPPSEIVTKPVIKNKNKNPQKPISVFDALFGSPSYNSKQKKRYGKTKSVKTKTVGVKLDEDNLKILDELPNSAVEMQVKDKFLKKLNRQERVVEEVKLVLKPHYNKKRINKEEYKDIMRRSVPKICHNKSGEINPTKIKNLIEAYVRKVRHNKKVTSSSSFNPLKI